MIVLVLWYYRTLIKDIELIHIAPIVVSLAGTSTWPNPQIATQRVHPTSIPISGSTTTTVTASGETPPLPPPTPVMPVTVKPIQVRQCTCNN